MNVQGGNKKEQNEDVQFQRVVLDTLRQSLENREVIAVVGAGVSAAATKVTTLEPSSLAVFSFGS